MLSAPSRRGKMPELAIRSVWWSMLGKGTPLLPKKSQEIPNLSSFSQEPPSYHGPSNAFPSMEQ